MPHSPLDIYAQFRFLDPDVYGTRVTAFRAQYAIMGGFDHVGDPVQPDSMDGPTLRISGLALMGGVDVTVRHPGESARDARRRRRLERKEMKRLGRGR